MLGRVSSGMMVYPGCPKTHHRGSILTGLSLSSPLIGMSGHWDGRRVEEKDVAATCPTMVEVYIARGARRALVPVVFTGAH
jgi:hypothetical protein